MIPVLHLRSGSGLYGADRAVLALAQQTAAPLWPIVGSIVAPGIPDALGAEAARRGLSSLELRSASKLDLRCALRVAEAVRVHGVQLVHAHDFKSVALGLLAALVTGVPLVATFHGDTGGSLKVRFYEALARVLANFTRGASVVSRALYGKVRKWVWFAPVQFVANGLPPAPPCGDAERDSARRALGLDANDLVLACVGRLSHEKGQAVLLEALRRLPNPPVLLLAGDGPDRAALEVLAQGLPVRFLGFVDDPRPIFAAADVVVLPSRTEGLPLVALEAALANRCVLATSVGELPVLLSEGAGRLVPPGDAQALAAAIAELHDSGLRAACAARARDRVLNDYSLRAMADAYARLYYAALPDGTPAEAQAR